MIFRRVFMNRQCSAIVQEAIGNVGGGSSKTPTACPIACSILEETSRADPSVVPDPGQQIGDRIQPAARHRAEN